MSGRFLRFNGFTNDQSHFLVEGEVRADLGRSPRLLKRMESVAACLIEEAQTFGKSSEEKTRGEGGEAGCRLDPKAIFVVEALGEFPGAFLVLDRFLPSQEILDGGEESVAGPFEPRGIPSRYIIVKIGREGEIGADERHKEDHHPLNKEIPKSIVHNFDIEKRRS